MSTVVRKSKVSEYDCEELAAAICGVTDGYESADDTLEFAETAMYEKFDISLESFHKIVEHLLPLIVVGKGMVNTYRGFAVDGCFVVKEEI
jgi:hypothetical protein